MSRIEHEARALLLSRLEALSRGPLPALAEADPSARWVDWEAQGELGADTLRHEVAEVEEALKRIDQGTYGRCLACGGSLGLQRLRAIPEARYCVSCSSRGEAPDCEDPGTGDAA